RKGPSPEKPRAAEVVRRGLEACLRAQRQSSRGAPLAPRMTVVLAGRVVPGASGVAGPGSVGLGSSRCGSSAAVSLSGGAAARSSAAFWLGALLSAGSLRARAAARWAAALLVAARRA